MQSAAAHEYSGNELETKAKEKGAEGSAAGWIRDLRAHITRALRRSANIDAGKQDAILSGNFGYRLP